MSRSRQLNYLQNDVWFSHLAQKLEEKMGENVIFQGEGKTHQYELCVKYIT